MPTITINLFNDLATIFRTELDEIGYNTTGITDPRDLMIVYFTIRKRLVPKKPRKVVKPSNFSCPAYLQHGLAVLEQKIINGDNLTPHLSRKMKNLEFADMMLFDWDIHHFHLGTSLEPDGFMQRTGDILYAKVTEDTIYFIKIQPHNNWSDLDLLEAINANWPELISDFRIGGKLTYKATSQDIAAFRKAHINMMIELSDGSTYMGMGMGVMTDGSSADAARITIDKMHECKQKEKFIEQNVNRYISEKKLPERDYEFHANRDSNGISCTDANKLVTYKLYNFLSIKQSFRF